MKRIVEKSLIKNDYLYYCEIIKFPINIKLTNFTQKYYNYVNNIIEIPKCYCGAECSFINIKSGYREFCSTKCASNSTVTKNKILKTCKKKYGVSRFNNIKKAKKTNLEKYGVEYVSQCEEIKNKVKKTNLEKYGAESYTKTAEYLKKTKETNLEKYGVEHHLKLDSQKNNQQYQSNWWSSTSICIGGYYFRSKIRNNWYG